MSSAGGRGWRRLLVTVKSGVVWSGGDVDGRGAGVGEGDGLGRGGVADLRGGEGEGALGGGVGDERRGVGGGGYEEGAALPARSMRSGLLRASLSMTRVPVSAVGSGDVVPVASLVEGGVGEGDGAGLVGGEGGAAGGGGDEEGPLAGDAADGDGVVPGLVRVRVWVMVWPEVTWPKLRTLGRG